MKLRMPPVRSWTIKPSNQNEKDLSDDVKLSVADKKFPIINPIFILMKRRSFLSAAGIAGLAGLAP